MVVTMSDSHRNEMVISSQDDLNLLLGKARVAAGVSQQDAANHVDSFRPYISKVENNGVHIAYVEKAFELLRLYGVTVTASFEDKG